jgi:thiamine-phosphate pyrophosphorylase
MLNPSRLAGLYAIADTRYLDDARLIDAVAEAIAGGARVIQYRDKKHTAVERTRQASELARLCRRQGTCFIVNDDVTLAKETRADGVHLGREDVPLAEARKLLGAQAIIGVSCYNELARAVAAQKQGADYVAFGRFFPSRTKPQAVQAGLDLLREAKTETAYSRRCHRRHYPGKWRLADRGRGRCAGGDRGRVRPGRCARRGRALRQFVQKRIDRSYRIKTDKWNCSALFLIQ